MGRLTDKVAIITGGASGMGREMVDLFTKEGAQVIAADINEKAVAAVNELANVHGTVLDVSSDESWKKVTDEVIAKFGKIDILVNNSQRKKALTIRHWPIGS